ncbi:hypothetical protein GCM10007385_10500 [Tateyamaria omphalii]|uniref:hypothetical protein n=1 Tax=Tateyamaria omphalii TaxID=299262 RepID=UPI0019875292|nr:hypothetical protein [Tateyamaria omphalii]GGX44455.1 hypothetical protein GCM10007385_10500 [Tateyamaria omphalii]
MRIGTNGAIATGTLCLIAIMIAAVADQDFGWWVVPFILLFGTLFSGVLALCVLNYRKDRFRRASISTHPDEPWMWDERWQSDTMTSRSKSELWGTLAFTVILAVFAFIGVASMLHGLPEGNLWVLLNIIPMVATAYFLRNSVVAWRALRLERHVSLTSEARPAWIGQTFSALVNTTTGQQADKISAWLEHTKVVRHEESDGVSFEKVMDRKLPGHVDDLGEGTARITVDIPKSSPTTSWRDDAQDRWWDLVISMRISGIEGQLRFEIPVAEPAEQKNRSVSNRP